MANLCNKLRRCGFLVPRRNPYLKTCLSYTSVRNNLTFNKPQLLSETIFKKFNVIKPISTVRCYGDEKSIKKDDNDSKKLTLFQRFRKMYKEYWYVLVPVHVVTSIGWFGGFYYMAISGVDIVPLLEMLHVSQNIIDSMRDSQMGYVAIAYALYKISTPARYTVTLGGTTISINYLKKWGYIKPVPSADQLKAIYKERKEHLMEHVLEKKHDIKEKADKLKDNLDDALGKRIHKFEEKLRDKRDSIKKKATILKDIKNDNK